MKTFKDRMMMTLSGGAVLLLGAILVAVMASLFIGLFIYLPTQFIASYSEKWATIWVVFVFVSFAAWAVFEDARRWFVWQFVEPFKKVKN